MAPQALQVTNMRVHTAERMNCRDRLLWCTGRLKVSVYIRMLIRVGLSLSFFFVLFSRVIATARGQKDNLFVQDE